LDFLKIRTVKERKMDIVKEIIQQPFQKRKDRLSTVKRQCDYPAHLGKKVFPKISNKIHLLCSHSGAVRICGSWALVAHACNPSYLGGRD
jgi:hypothetical protein